MSKGITRARRDAAHPVSGWKRRAGNDPASGPRPAPHATERRSDDLIRFGLRAARTSRGELARLGLLGVSRIAFEERRPM